VAHGPTAVLYGLAGITGICMALFRAVVLALIPWLATSADELVSSNVVASMIEGLGTLAGPLIGGLVAATAGPQAVFLGAGVLALLGLAVVARIRPEGQEMRTSAHARAGVGKEIGEGFREVRENRDARLVLKLFFAQTF